MPHAFGHRRVRLRTTGWRPHRPDPAHSGRWPPLRHLTESSRPGAPASHGRACVGSRGRAGRLPAASRLPRAGVGNRLSRETVTQPRQSVRTVEIAVPLTDALLELDLVAARACP